MRKKQILPPEKEGGGGGGGLRPPVPPFYTVLTYYKLMKELSTDFCGMCSFNGNNISML